MNITANELVFFSSLQSMSDMDFMKIWHETILEGNEQRIALVESAATGRYGIADWRARYISQYPDQTRY
jgi:hypothetical protein